MRVLTTGLVYYVRLMGLQELRGQTNLPVIVTGTYGAELQFEATVFLPRLAISAVFVLGSVQPAHRFLF